MIISVTFPTGQATARHLRRCAELEAIIGAEEEDEDEEEKDEEEQYWTELRADGTALGLPLSAPLWDRYFAIDCCYTYPTCNGFGKGLRRRA